MVALRGGGVGVLGRLVEWFGDPAQWSGSTGIPARVLEHLGYTLLAVALEAVVALPLGAVIGHTRRGGLAVVGAVLRQRSPCLPQSCTPRYAPW